jgi:hypothetical protein
MATLTGATADSLFVAAKTYLGGFAEETIVSLESPDFRQTLQKGHANARVRKGLVND